MVGGVAGFLMPAWSSRPGEEARSRTVYAQGLIREPECWRHRPDSTPRSTRSIVTGAEIYRSEPIFRWNFSERYSRWIAWPSGHYQALATSRPDSEPALPDERHRPLVGRHPTAKPCLQGVLPESHRSPGPA